MKCPKCQKENAVGADFCVWCGTPLFGMAHAPGRPLSEADGLPEVKRHINEMAVRLSKVEGRVTLIGERMGLEPVKSQLAVSSAEKPPKAELPQKAAAEAVAPEKLSPAATRKSPGNEPKVQAGAGASSAGQTVPAKPVVAAAGIAAEQRGLSRGHLLDGDPGARFHRFEDCGVADNPAEDRDGTGRANLIAAAGGRPPEEQADRWPIRPVGHVSHLDHFAPVLNLSCLINTSIGILDNMEMIN